MKKNAAISLIICPILVLGLAAILIKNTGRPPKTAELGKLRVVASFYPLYFMSAQIGGDKAEVINILPTGAEPHDYEPTAKDMAKMENSQLIILNGNGLEAWSDNLKKNINAGRTNIIEARAEIRSTNLDPHVWLDPALAQKMVDKIAQSFERTDPLNKSYYETNANALKSRLNDLDNAYKQALSKCAEKNIITSHAAFGYLAAAYGLKQIPIAGLSPDTEPTPQQLTDLIKFAKTNNIKYIFFESLASPKLAQTIAAEVGAQTLTLNPLEGLSQEELAQGKNYLSIMQDNLKNLQIALECSK